MSFLFYCCGGWTRTTGLQVMSLTSCQLLYSAILFCKGRAFFCFVNRFSVFFDNYFPDTRTVFIIKILLMFIMCFFL